MSRNFGNGYASAITTGPNAGATTTTPASVTGAPAVPFDARLRNSVLTADGLHFTKEEICQVTLNSAGTFTITRASEAIWDGSQSAVDFSAGAAVIEQVFTAGAVGTLASFIPDPGASWAATTAYSVGDRVKDTGTPVGDSGVAVFECIVAGTSGGSNPFGWAWTPKTDGTVTWAFIGAIGGLDGRLISQPLVTTTGTNEIDVGSMGYAHGNGAVYAGPAARTDGTGTANVGSTGYAHGNGDVYAGPMATTDGTGTADASPEAYANGNGNANAVASASVGGSGTATAGVKVDYQGLQQAYVEVTASAAAHLAIHDGTGVGTAPQILMSDGTNAVWTTPLVRHAAGVPSGAPTTGELPFAFDSTAITGGLYFWDGAAWVKGSTIP